MSVVIPARDEEATVAGVVAPIVALGVHEVVVVDDGSGDATATRAADAGARVVRAAEVLPRFGASSGKGEALWKGVARTDGDIVVFCDADLEDFDASYVTRLVDALLADPRAALAKPRYRRAGTGGRVNELVARPALRLLHPALGGVRQPLGGEYAAWRSVLEQVPFVRGYGVDLGLVIDVARRFGPASVVEAELPERRHRNRPLAELVPQAERVLEVALARAGVPGVHVEELPPLASVEGYGRKTA
ncbi:MAG TPA: glucosyl-3-phosphoglycerate synthase [Acidimicrobiales bacterium]|nr:glucosyl-3-phosphoglycerate synthase [Acidimicrobiales bacterium]